jgi:hypothetical protein
MDAVRHFTASWLCACALLSSCGGGGGSDPAPSPPASPAPASGSDTQGPTVALTSPAAPAVNLTGTLTLTKLQGNPVDVLAGNDGSLYVLTRDAVARIGVAP